MSGFPIPSTSRQWLWSALAVTLLFRAWLSTALPITGDEAYFLLWGKRPDLGYYDHPPMIGWLLALLARWSDAEWLIRLPALLAPPLVALGVRAMLRNWFARDADTADLAAIALLLVPMNVWNVLITTDTPLMLFSLASLALFVRAAQRESASLFLLAGVLLGLAFLSKYLAVLLGVAYVAWALFSPDARLRWRSLALAGLGALPFGLFNLWWNYRACWCNVMFNAINRHDDAALSATTPALYIASLAYLAAPFAWYAWRRRGALREAMRQRAPRVLLLAWVVPLAVFAALSPSKRIGLHWLLSFLPALVLSMALILERAQLAACARFFAWFAVLHAGVIVAVAALPIETWKSSRLYPRLVFLVKTSELLDEVKPLLGRYRLASDSYSGAALLSYHARTHVLVFGAASSHARHDDILTDFRRLDGRDLLILRREPPLEQDYRPYFREIELRSFEARGVTFHAVLGRGFDYAGYREGVLRQVRERFYRIPAWLPIGGCYFCERYFPGEPCRPAPK